MRGRDLKNGEENFLGKVSGNIPTKFYYNPSIVKKYGILRGEGGFPLGEGEQGGFRKTKKRNFLGR